MEASFALLALWMGNSPVTGEFPSQRLMTQNFDVFFDMRLNKRFSKRSRRRWLETQSHSLWRHCNVSGMYLLHQLVHITEGQYYYKLVISCNLLIHGDSLSLLSFRAQVGLWLSFDIVCILRLDPATRKICGHTQINATIQDMSRP